MRRALLSHLWSITELQSLYSVPLLPPAPQNEGISATLIYSNEKGPTSGHNTVQLLLICIFQLSLKGT